MTELASQSVPGSGPGGQRKGPGASPRQQAGPRGGLLGALGSVIFQPAHPASSFREATKFTQQVSAVSGAVPGPERQAKTRAGPPPSWSCAAAQVVRLAKPLGSLMFFRPHLLPLIALV